MGTDKEKTTQDRKDHFSRPTKQTKRHENQLHSFVLFQSVSWANGFGCELRRNPCHPWLISFLHLPREIERLNVAPLREGRRISSG